MRVVSGLFKVVTKSLSSFRKDPKEGVKDGLKEGFRVRVLEELESDREFNLSDRRRETLGLGFKFGREVSTFSFLFLLKKGGRVLLALALVMVSLVVLVVVVVRVRVLGIEEGE